MAVISSKLATIPFVGYDGTHMAVNVKTGNQSVKRQKLLWTIHGSGGVSSSDELWQQAALDRGYSVAWVDHYSPRRIFKMNHTVESETNLWSVDMAADIIAAKHAIDDNAAVVPFLSLRNIKFVGFSTGATAAMYLTTWKSELYWIDRIAALYPGLWPLTDRILTIDGAKICIYVGEDDDWTPSKHAVLLNTFVPELQIMIWPETMHSFSKPGSGGYYDNIVRTSDISYPIPVPLADVKSRSGRYAELLDENLGLNLGVHAEFNLIATANTISHFLD